MINFIFMKRHSKILLPLGLMVFWAVILCSCDKIDPPGYAIPIEMEYEGVKVERINEFRSSCVLPQEGGTVLAKAIDKDDYIRKTAKYLDVHINDEFVPDDNYDDEKYTDNMSYKGRDWGEIYNIGTSLEPIIKVEILPNNTGSDRKILIQFGCCNSYADLKIIQKGR